MRIAIFDYITVRDNPTGGCVLALLNGLCEEHEFTVFSAALENPRPDRIRWVRIPMPLRPLAFLFLWFHVVAALFYLWYRIRGGPRFDLIQIAESNLWFGDISYAHFCHRAFLRDHWHGGRPRSLRAFLKWLDHWFHALLEPWVFRRMRRIVTPSRGLANELERHYPELAGKITAVPNPVDVESMAPPSLSERRTIRAGLNLREEEIALVFCALGHFERKGLGLLLDALEDIGEFPWRLIVVGGRPDALAPYRNRGNGRAIFTGMQKDIRPFLWAADAFALPSSYETFSLVTFEAAAARLPLLVSQLYGVEEILRDGENGILLPRNRKELETALRRFIARSSTERHSMGAQAQRDVASYGPTTFVDRWRCLFREMPQAHCASSPATVRLSSSVSEPRP